MGQNAKQGLWEAQLEQLPHTLCAKQFMLGV